MTRAPFHPEAIARARAHAAARGSCPGRSARPATKRRPAQPAEPCTCTPDPTDLVAVWAGRARMARARRAAGVTLDALDVEALDRTAPVHPLETGRTPGEAAA